MASFEVGIRFDGAGVAYFGLEKVNKQLAAGLKIKELRPGGVVASKTGEEGDNVTMKVTGCQIVVVFESD